MYATSCVYDALYGGSTTMKGGAMNTVDVMTVLNSKKEFLLKVFATLISQESLTYYVMTRYNREKDKSKTVPKTWVLVVASFAIILMISLVPMSIYLKFGLFTLFSGVIGVLFSDLMRVVDPNIVQMAVLGTIGIFASFFLVGAGLLISGIALGVRTGLFLLFSLLLLIVAMVVSYFTGEYASSYRLLSGIGLFIFSAYIVYDTNKILQKDYRGDFVTASLDYYLDMINIFIRLVNFNRG
mgnify:CR=1 FL=1